MPAGTPRSHNRCSATPGHVRQEVITLVPLSTYTLSCLAPHCTLHFPRSRSHLLSPELLQRPLNVSFCFRPAPHPLVYSQRRSHRDHFKNENVSILHSKASTAAFSFSRKAGVFLGPMPWLIWPPLLSDSIG